jgi:hypothetical protein
VTPPDSRKFSELLHVTGHLVRPDAAALDLKMWAGVLRAFVRRG